MFSFQSLPIFLDRAQLGHCRLVTTSSFFLAVCAPRVTLMAPSTFHGLPPSAPVSEARAGQYPRLLPKIILKMPPSAFSPFLLKPRLRAFDLPGPVPGLAFFPPGSRLKLQNGRSRSFPGWCHRFSFFFLLIQKPSYLFLLSG